MNAPNRAVVVGASISGLLTARVLSDVYDQVTLVDRDVMPASPGIRRGVPQGRHAHSLLAAGCAAVEDLLPGFTDDAVQAGALRVDLQQDLHWYCEGHRLYPAPSGLAGLVASRPLLEHVIRTRVAARPGVQLMAGCDAVGLASAGRGQRVTGVTIMPRRDGAASSVLPADLVVDATGRSSRAPLWMAELGYHGPAEEQCGLGASFASRLYRREPGALGGRAGSTVIAGPGSPRGAMLLAQEGGTFVLTTVSLGGTEPPADDAGLAAFSRRLPGPDVAEVTSTAARLSKIVRLRYPRGIWRRYDQLTRFPAGFLVTGDALCSLSPVHAQGMSVAALEASLLRRLLAEGPQQLAPRFFTATAGLLRVPWAITRGPVQACSGPGGGPGGGAPGGRGGGASGQSGRADFTSYLGLLYAAAAGDPVLAAALLGIASLVHSPGVLFTDEIRSRVRAGGGSTAVS
jgi:2-polyprenyl-6-methoxyphenol hydroxylase-like FAD-dependent oxidoreductase